MFEKSKIAFLLLITLLITGHTPAFAWEDEDSDHGLQNTDQGLFDDPLDRNSRLFGNEPDETYTYERATIITKNRPYEIGDPANRRRPKSSAEILRAQLTPNHREEDVTIRRYNQD